MKYAGSWKHGTIVAALTASAAACSGGRSDRSPAAADAGSDAQPPPADGPADGTGDGPDAGIVCGDGVVGGSEQCDLGDANGAGVGCELDCTFSCTGDAECDDGEPCNGAERCASFEGGRRCASGAAVDDGTECSQTPRRICVAAECTESVCGDGVIDAAGGEECEPPDSGSCTPACRLATCGDGKVEGDEECDRGASNGPGTGCELGCSLSCHGDADCEDGEPCNGAEICDAAPGGMACSSGPPPAESSPCGVGGYCKLGVCTQPTCGDGTVEPGETCEPPGTPECSADCRQIVCGDGVIVGDEECDDGNALRLDGCTPDCRYEIAARFSYIEVAKGLAPSFCLHPDNRFGQALEAAAILELNKEIKAGIDGGGTNIVGLATGFDDPIGVDDPFFEFGVTYGVLDGRAGTFVPGALDWWFLADPSTVAPDGTLNQRLSPAAVTNRVFTAGPGTIVSALQLGDAINLLEFADMTVKSRVLASPPPSAPAPPPATVAPGLRWFEQVDGTGDGEGFCAYITVRSLAKVPVLKEFTAGSTMCTDSCGGSRTYTYCGPGQPVGPGCNSLLDVLVGGCKTSGLCVPVASPTQPDVGTGTPLVPDSDGKVTPPVPTDGYSGYWKFRIVRAHLTNNLP